MYKFQLIQVTHHATFSMFAYQSTPPWLFDHPHVNFDLHCFLKEDTPPEIYRSRFLELCSHYDGFRRLYTYGSKIGDQVASVAVAGNFTKRSAYQIEPVSSERNYTQFLLPWILFVIAKTVDLSSSLIQSQAWKPSMALELNCILCLKLSKTTSLIKAGKVIEFCWIPSHVNIPGSERADTAAKAALCLPVTSMKLPASEFKTCTSRFCLEEWQDIWNSAANNELHAICPTVGKCVHNDLVSRRDAVVVNRLKIGHSRLTHGIHIGTYSLERTNQYEQSVRSPLLFIFKSVFCYFTFIVAKWP